MASGRPSRLYRIFFHRHATTGAVTSPWRFTSVPPGKSRFDLAEPQGTCYWSDRRYGSWVEVFRGTAVVERSELTRRRLFTAEPPPLHLANTLALAARRFGVTGELSTIADYTLPHRWASALAAVGFAGLVGICRHDPSLTARNVAVFGPAGAPARRAGWRTSRTALETDTALAAELDQLGVRVAGVPHAVPITPVP
jgi:hypothetical protein